MKLSEEVDKHLTKIETGLITDISDAYIMLTRCFLELRRLEHKTEVLEDKLRDRSE